MTVLSARWSAAPRRVAVIVPPVAVGIAFLVLWELAVTVFDISAFLLPKPSAIWSALLDQWSIIMEAARSTASNAITGLVIGVVLGVFAALLTSRSRSAREIVTPIAAGIAAMPIIALAPVFNVWFGITTSTAKQLVVTIVVFMPVFVNVSKGLAQAEATQLELMRSFAASPAAVMRKVRIPTALPYLFSALRLAASLSIIAAIVAEYFGGRRDALGVYIQQAAGLTRYDQAWAGVLVACVIGISLFVVVLIAERVAMPWAGSQRQQRS